MLRALERKTGQPRAESEQASVRGEKLQDGEGWGGEGATCLTTLAPAASCLFKSHRPAYVRAGIECRLKHEMKQKAGTEGRMQAGRGGARRGGEGGGRRGRRAGGRTDGQAGRQADEQTDRQTGAPMPVAAYIRGLTNGRISLLFPWSI